jgi:ubiquinone biosynthesis protein
VGLSAIWRIARAGYVLAREGAFAITEGQDLPAGARRLIGFARLIERRSVRKTGRVERLARALERLGPTYVKLGQLLGTRPDIVGPAIAEDLSGLQDRMPPFDQKLVPGMLKKALGETAAAQLTEISEPIAAASIAQVHKAVLVNGDGAPVTVAVKLLRPDIEERFRRDLEAVMTLAKLAERFSKPSRRLRPVDTALTLERTAVIEMDLRLEAAAMSQMAENIEGHSGFAVPKPYWQHTARNVLVTEWFDGIPIRDNDALDAAGIDRPKLARDLLQHFLRHAIEDGFFHADMHPGNLFVEAHTGTIRAVDFGIMGRIGKTEQRFLAEVLYGFITRSYRRIAQLHIDIGYVPDHHDVEDFAQALRAIGEPLHGRKASEISMARVLAQLFEVTELFDMKTRTELVLLQKTMVLVEGVARHIDPNVDFWTTAEPVVGPWVRRQLGPAGIIEKAADTLRDVGEAARKVPQLVARYEAILEEAEAQRQAPPPVYLRGWFAGLTVVTLVLVLLAALKTVLT